MSGWHSGAGFHSLGRIKFSSRLKGIWTIDILYSVDFQEAIV
jgi:hypothetical protein